MQTVMKSFQLKKELDTLRPLPKEAESRIMDKFRLDWNYHSNNLEGNTLTYGETKALLLFGITAQGKPLKDHFEITGHNEVIKWVLEVVKEDRPLTEIFIRELHKLILKESYEVDAITPDGKPSKKKIRVGEYKRTPNHVKTKTGEIFRFATPEETPAKMHDLIDWYRQKLEDESTNPILLAAEFHYRYTCIHPFDDGNGRTARILMNFILIQAGYPPVIIKTEDKANYFATLQQADAGILTPFVQYIAENLNRSLELMIKGAQGENIEEPDDLDKEIALLEQQLKATTESSKHTKNKELLSKLYDQSILRLSQKFLEKGKLFEKFYTKTTPLLRVDGIRLQASQTSILYSLKLSLDEHTNSVKLTIAYQGFNQVGFKSFNQISQILFQFNLNTYKVSVSNLSYEKLYHEQLTEEEINNLVSFEIRKHKQVLEAKIEEIRKQQ